tara:strand:- start:10250 stop:11479 length:1230 start_codon:yes stop_codon:yes gene_type:complete
MIRPLSRSSSALFLSFSLAACGGGESSASENPEYENAPRTREEVQAAVDKALEPVRNTKGLMERAREAQNEVVELPSHRQLRSFLPTSLEGLPEVHLESQSNDGNGIAQAEGRYKEDASDHLKTIELNVRYFGKPYFNSAERMLSAGFGKKRKIAGFDAVVSEQDDRGKLEVEIHLRISPEVWIEASGGGSVARVQNALEQIDLDALASAAGDRTLFQPTEADRLQESILSAFDLGELLPKTIGTLTRKGSDARAHLKDDPMHCVANASYGQGTLKLYDYGSAAAAARIELAPNDIQHFQMFGFGQTGEPVVAEVDVTDGSGMWAHRVAEAPRQGSLAIQLVRGRFLLEYIGPFVPAAPEIQSNVPDSMREVLLENQRQMGAGAFPTIEAQRDAIVAIFEALDLSEYSN